MKTICFVYPTVFDPERGGVERVTDMVSRSLLKRGYKVLYLHHKKPENDNFDYPCPVFYFPSSNLSASENISFYHNFIQENKIDVILNACGCFNDSKLYLDVPNDNRPKTISILHSNPLLYYNYFFENILPLKNKSAVEHLKRAARVLLCGYLKRKFLKRRTETLNMVCEKSDAVVLLSEGFKKALMTVTGDKYAEKVSSIANPNCYEAKNDFEKENVILYVGRFTHSEKRPDRVLKIWKRIYQMFPYWKLIFVGDGPMRESMEEEAKKMERVLFVGFANPMPYYQRAKILCLTSNYEGFPMVLAEAMSFGAVPFSFDSYDACRDILTREECIVKPFDLDEYVEKLTKVMSDECLLTSIRDENYNILKKFNIETITDQWVKLIED